MSTSSQLASVVESLREKASVRTVYGDPIVEGDRTIIPVARVAYGFGGGYGSATGEEMDEAAGEGGGVGGGLSVSPIGVIEMTSEGTRFVSARGRGRTVAALGLGLLGGILVGRAVQRQRARRREDVAARVEAIVRRAAGRAPPTRRERMERAARDVGRRIRRAEEHEEPETPEVRARRAANAVRTRVGRRN